MIKRNRTKKRDEPVEVVVDDGDMSVEFRYGDGVVNRILAKDRDKWSASKAALIGRLEGEGYRVVDRRGGVTRLAPRGPGEEAEDGAEGDEVAGAR